MSNATPVGYTPPTWFDNLPPQLRHALFSILAAACSVGLPWIQTNYTSWNLPAGVLAVIGMFLPLIVATVTPLTSQYGVTPKAALSTGAEITGTADSTTPPPEAVVVDDHVDPAPVDPPVA